MSDLPGATPAGPGTGEASSNAEALWGRPDSTGRYLVAVVEHGDDMSEEDYSVVGNHLLGAISQAARDYGYDPHDVIRGRVLRYLTSEYANPLEAELQDGTVIVAYSRSSSGRGRVQQIRRPTPREHARWAGLPIPPEPPPPPPPPPCVIDVVWGRVAAQAGTDFTTRRGKRFTYAAFPWNLWVRKPDGTGTSLGRGMFSAALDEWPVSGPSSLPVACGHGLRTYLWAILADERILGLSAEPGGAREPGANIERFDRPPAGG